MFGINKKLERLEERLDYQEMEIKRLSIDWKFKRRDRIIDINDPSYQLEVIAQVTAKDMDYLLSNDRGYFLAYKLYDTKDMETITIDKRFAESYFTKEIKPSDGKQDGNDS